LYAQTPILMYSTATLKITQEQRLQAGASAYLTEAADILDPGPILLKLIAETKIAAPTVDSRMADELEIVTN
jgi:CheY-like chemotaxis protein